MKGCQLLSDVCSLILSNDRAGLLQLIQNHSSTIIEVNDFECFINSFLSTHIELEDCININGSGGSGIPKINTSSIACIYVSVITNMKVVKTGSKSNTSLIGSSDLFDKLGLLYASEKTKGLELFNFAYYDFLQLSLWKKYREILALNKSLKYFMDNGIFFDYPAKAYCIGVALSSYYDKFHACKMYNPPNKLITYYTNTKYGVVDEITQGDVFINGQYILTIDGDLYLPCNKKEVLEEDIRLIYGRSDNKSSIDSVRFTTALLLQALCECDIDDGVAMFNDAYENKKAGKLVDNLRLYYKKNV